MGTTAKRIGAERRRRREAARRHASRKHTPARAGRDLFTPQRGGARQGAGRKPTGAVALVPHDLREPFAARFPVHVTMRCVSGLPSLRAKPQMRVLRLAFAAGCERFGFRLIEFAVLANHLHLIVEGRDRRALVRGLQGLFIRCAKGLNRLWRRTGKVFADRHHDRVLRTPREVRAALCYVLGNARKHGVAVAGVDPCSSGPWFEGWRECDAMDGPRWLARARTWMLASGWRRHGRIGLRERPRAWPVSP